MRKYNFIIITHQRCGSHLLATCLNSHPDIACEGESGDKIIKYTNGSFNGMIWMCNRYFNEKNIPNADKYIYLVRNPKDTAISMMLNGCSRRTNANHKAHFFGNENIEHYKLKEREINRLTYHVKSSISGFINILKIHGIKDYMTVRYEDLTDDGKEIEWLPEKEAKRILDFLGLKYYPLRTNLVRSRRTYEIDNV